MHVDSFSGSAADLPKGKRTPDYVLAALRRDPRLSTFDMSEYPWLRDCIAELQARGLIFKLPEPYPWLRYRVVKDAGNERA